MENEKPGYICFITVIFMAEELTSLPFVSKKARRQKMLFRAQKVYLSIYESNPNR